MSKAERVAVISRAERGIDAPQVIIETQVSGGLPGFAMVGLPETAVREARERVKGAIQASRFTFPKGKITVNLAPADLPKEGGRFDLGIALGILAHTGALPATRLHRFEAIGELGLYGEIRPVRGALSAAIAAGNAGHGIIVPRPNRHEAGLAHGVDVRAVEHLDEACALLNSPDGEIGKTGDGITHTLPAQLALSDVKGQPAAKRALEIAAAGAHHLLFMGPPGTGKTMLAERLNSLLPALTESDALEVVRIHSAHGTFDANVLHGVRPLRAPHHTASAAALVGGGGRIPSPAQFQLIAAMNPCPAGRACSESDCVCSLEQQRRYRNRISGPLLDRIDLRVFVPNLDSSVLFAASASRTDIDEVRARVEVAHRTQLARAGKLNSRLTPPEIDAYCELDGAGRLWMGRAMDKLGLSARGVHRVLKVARTLADLVGDVSIASPHLTEALAYREIRVDY